MFNLLSVELYKIFQRPRTYIAFVVIGAIVGIFQAAFKIDGQSYLSLMLQSVPDSFELDLSNVINGYFMCYIILNTLLVQVPILIALIAADAISGEANMGTLRLVLTRPVSRTQLILAKFAASVVFTILLLIWMAVVALFLSLFLFGAEDLLIFRVKGEESLIMQLTKDDILWRYMAAFGYAAVALSVIAALALLLSLFSDNSIGPIVTTVCIVIVCTILTNINVPVIDENVKPWLFTSYLVGWKGFFYIATTAEGETIKGSLENWPAIRSSLFILIAHLLILVGASVYIFNKKDILS